MVCSRQCERTLDCVATGAAFRQDVCMGQADFQRLIAVVHRRVSGCSQRLNRCVGIASGIRSQICITRAIERQLRSHLIEEVDDLLKLAHVATIIRGLICAEDGSSAASAHF